MHATWIDLPAIVDQNGSEDNVFVRALLGELAMPEFDVGSCFCVCLPRVVGPSSSQCGADIQVQARGNVS